MKRIGIIGVGGIANGVHIPQLQKIEGCKITAICDVDKDRLKKAGELLGISEEYQFNDYKELIDSGCVDGVEICTPNHVHIEIAEYAVSKGMPMNLEKPMGLNVAECERLAKLANEKNALNMMCFSYRFFPAVRYAKWILNKKLLGDIVSVDVKYLKSSAFWEGRKLDWRFEKKYAGTGVLGDLGVHLIDMAQFLVGEFKSVAADRGIVVKKRMRLDCDEWADVETDDYCNFIAKLDVGEGKDCVPATFNISRCAIGHANTVACEIFGTDGVLSFDFNTPEILKVCIGEVDKKSDGIHTINVPAEFYLTQEQAYVDALNGKFCEYFPTVNDGVKCQKIIEAIEKSSDTGAFVKL